MTGMCVEEMNDFTEAPSACRQAAASSSLIWLAMELAESRIIPSLPHRNRSAGSTVLGAALGELLGSALGEPLGEVDGENEGVQLR